MGVVYFQHFRGLSQQPNTDSKKGRKGKRQHPGYGIIRLFAEKSHFAYQLC